MRPINRFLERWIPSALTFAIVLTLIVAILAMTLTQTSPVDVVKGWGDGLAGLLAFMTQMCLILLLGYMLANTRPVQKLLRRLARVPKSAAFAYVFVFVIAAIASLITWGLGLIVGTLLAREIAVEARGDVLPITETTFSTWNMLAALGVIIVVGALMFFIRPKKNDPIYELPVSVG